MKPIARSIAALATLALALGAAHNARAQTAYLLSGSGSSLSTFNLATPGTSSTVSLSGATAFLSDIDFRVSNGLLYGYSQTTNQIFTVNTSTGVTTFVSTPSTASTDVNSGIDFNPAADRMRIVANNDQNLRVNVDTGATTVDGTLKYATGDDNFGANPNILDVAYTNNDNNPLTGTTLYYLDNNPHTLVTTADPNNGTLNTVGALGFIQDNNFGFDIFTDANGVNSAFAIGDTATGSGLYRVNLTTGAGALVGDLNMSDNVYGLAIAPVSSTAVPEPGSIALLVGVCVTGAGFARKRRSLR